MQLGLLIKAMRLRPFIIILPLLWWGFDVRAQAPEQMPAPAQWQLTLDGIKSKAQSLIIENNGLQLEYQQLTGQVQNLQQSISQQQYKNEQINRFLKERHGQTDQQMRTEELTQGIKRKSQEARSSEEQLENLNRKQSGLDRKIKLLQYSISDMELHQQEEKQEDKPSQNTVILPVDDQLSQLRKQLEDESTQEVLLENELGALKTGDKTQNLNVDAINSENKQLEAHLDILRLQKLQHEEKSSDTQLSQANARMYEKLKRRKEQLEASIYAYESRMDELKQSSLMALSWPLKKKKLVHEMVQVDGRNNQMRDKIKGLREDIDILRDQVAKLERRVDFVQGKDATFRSVP